jgi:pimeloyl-ACP methyl ester carboxylesterase
MESAFLTFKSSRIHFRKSGAGSKLAICFHGFGTYANTFDWIAQHVPDHTFIAFDLPYHGSTQWNEKNISVDELIRIIDLCPGVSQQPFALVGYSMGGRISLSILEKIPSRITRLVLLAPDGLHVNPWYWFATQTSAGNRIFHHVMYKPQKFVKLVRKAGNYHLVNKGILKFIDRYMDDEGVRIQVYKAWTAFSSFRPNLKKIVAEIKNRNIPVTLVYGKFDNIIPFKPGQDFAHRLGPQCKFTVLDCGHQVLHIRNAQYIADSFTPV